MTEDEKKDWVVARFGRGTFVDPVAFYDALHGGRDGRIAETLRMLLVRHSDEKGRLIDPVGLRDELRVVADALGAR